jgi:RNA-directed DNA polymerase
MSDLLTNGTAVVILVAFSLIAAVFVLLLCLSIRRRTNGRPLTALRVRLGWGMAPKELARRLDTPLEELAKFEPRYRSVAVPKRTAGYRKLLIPDKYTKRLQRRILRRLLGKLRAHQAACGFERGRSIVHNALPHVGRAVVIKIDVEEFFPTTRAERLDAYFRRIGWNRDAAALLVRLVSYEGGLPQGAPTSPRLSNLVNYSVDVALSSYAARGRGAYTRYADDITFSFPHGDHPEFVRWIVHATRRVLVKVGYTMHERRKLSIRRRHQQQTVTGLVVNDKVQLPRKTRRWLRAVKHRAATGGASTLRPEQIDGWVALEKMIAAQAGGSEG